MSEHQKETAFLRLCIRYDDSPERHQLEERIDQVQRDERSLRRTMWLLAWLTALAVVGLGYVAVLLEGFTQTMSLLIFKIIGVLGLASLISLLAFRGLAVAHRKKMNRHREECRCLVAKLLESRLGKPVGARWQDI